MHVTVDPSVQREPIATDATDQPTVCVLCSQNCSLRVDVKDNEIVEVRADEASPASHGYVCNKGFTVGKYARHGQRVEHPMRRRPDGTFERISWDTAITEIAAKLGAVRDAHGGRAIGLVGIGGQANHMDAAYGLSFLEGLGSRRWFNAFAQEKTQHNLMDQWMFDATPAAMLHPDQEHTDYLLLMGTNAKVSNRGHSPTTTLRRLSKDPDRTLVVVDPRQTETTRGADIHVQLRPGTDCYLMIGMIAAIIEHDAYDQSFVADKSIGFEALRSAVAGIAAADMAERCGLTERELVDVALGFSRARSASILCDLGVEQNRFSTLNSYLIRVLLVITGNVGNRGGSMFYQTFNPPDPRRVEHGETERAIVSGIHGIRALGSYAMFSPSLVPEEVLVDHPERIRALIVEGANPLLSFSDTTQWRKAIEHLDVMVVIEPAMTETARAADYVLPTPVGYEKWEFSAFPKSFPEIHTQIRPPVLAGPTEALPEPEIYARLAEKMKLFGAVPAPMRALSRVGSRASARALMVIAATVAAGLSRGGGGVQSRLVFWLYRALGPHLKSPALTAVWLVCFKNAFLRRKAVLRTLGSKWRWRSPFAITEELYRRVMDNPGGVEIARLDAERNLDDHLGFRDKRVRLAPQQMVQEIRRALDTRPEADADHPFVLYAGIRTPWTANTIHRDPNWRKGKGPHCALFINPEDAARLNLAAGDSAIVETSVGRVELPVSLDKKIRPGQVAVPNGFGMVTEEADGTMLAHGVNLNELTAADDRDPFTGCPHHKHVRCNVRPAVAKPLSLVS
jgi:anaerobic selenocysteine-containing dehydrogenase